jgi:hypothetical protein
MLSMVWAQWLQVTGTPEHEKLLPDRVLSDIHVFGNIR